MASRKVHWPMPLRIEAMASSSYPTPLHQNPQPHFIKTHLDRSRNTKFQQQQQQSLIFLSKSGSLFSVPLTLRNANQFDEITEPLTKLCFAGDTDPWANVIASSDGLVLVSDKERNNFLINPVTREIRQVPCSPSRMYIPACSTVYGLGYDSVNLDYKIVSLSYYNAHHMGGPDCTRIFFSVYSVKNGTWKKAEGFPYCHDCGHIIQGTFVDGYIHWLTSKTIGENENKSNCFGIAAFDLAQEKFYEIPCPSSSRDYFDHHLVELGGCLCLYPFNTRNEIEFEVWMMKEYGNKESWTKFTITKTKGLYFRPLCMLGKEQALVALKQIWISDGKLVKYNLEKGTLVKDIVVHGISDAFRTGATKTFIESLVSPHS